MAVKNENNSLLKFLTTVGELKNVKRQGWIDHKIKNPESVSDHMYRMAVISLVLNLPENIKSHCVQLSLVHDMAECVVGDITPHDNISPTEKHLLEKNALIDITKDLNEDIKNKIISLWEEYEAQQTFPSYIVKDVDRFEMILQAYEYEKGQSKDLQDFFDSTKGKFKTDIVKNVVEELYELRLGVK